MSHIFQTILSDVYNKGTREDSVAKVEAAQKIWDQVRYQEHNQKLSGHKTTCEKTPDKTTKATFLTLEIKDKWVSIEWIWKFARWGNRKVHE